MSEIYRKLTLRDFREGAVIYWQLTASFWINYFVGLIFVLLAIQAIDRILSFSVYHHFPVISKHSWIIVFGVGVCIVLLIPFLVKISKLFEKFYESYELRGKYSMLKSLDRINRGIVIVSSVVILYLFQRHQNDGWFLLFALMMILISSGLLSMAIYGWMSRQFKDSE